MVIYQMDVLADVKPAGLSSVRGLLPDLLAARRGMIKTKERGQASSQPFMSWNQFSFHDRSLCSLSTTNYCSSA